MRHSRRTFLQALAATVPGAAYAAQGSGNWPGFRGPGARGVADGYPAPAVWDVASSKGVRWRTSAPGLGHSSPILWGDRLFLLSAVRADAGKAPLQIGRSGAADSANDNGEQSWVALCYDAATGREIWRRTARKASPRVSRHQKATHANTTATTDGKHLVAFFGSEGLYCYDLDGNLLWERDLGVVNISKYGIGWGYGSSPTLYQDRIALLCDDPEKPFLVVLRLSDGKELWRVSRKGDCERSWGAPMIHADGNRVQVVANGWPWIVSYDLETGEEIWRLAGGGDNPIPTPFEAHGWIYVTNAHGGKSPIYAIRPGAKGDITPAPGKANESVVWNAEQGGSYISTPVVYNGRMYFGNTNGVVRCFASKTGEMLYEERLDADASLYASLVAADGKIYCPAENGTVYVLRDGPKLEILARNAMGAPCFATPAVSKGVLFFRTTEELIAVG